MKVKTPKLYYYSILFQVLSTHGILWFFVFNFIGFWELKSLVHPISLMFLFTTFLFQAVRKIKISVFDILLFGYFLLSFIILLFNAPEISKIYLSSREVFLIYILIFIYSQIHISKGLMNKILNLVKILVFVNIIFIILTFYLGPEEYMKMLTGRYFWGIDPDYKFKISNFYKFWRSPGLIGDAASIGYFGLISYLLFDRFSPKKKVTKFFSFGLVLFSFVRSVYLVLFIYEFLKFFTKKKNLKNLMLVLKFGAPIILGFGLYLSKYNIFSLTSFFIRIKHWFNDIDVNFNLIIGGAIGKIGAAVRGNGFAATVDNYWLYLIMSLGLVGFVLIILFIRDKMKIDNKFVFILIAFLAAGVFITLTQSIVFLAMFPLFFINIYEDDDLRNEAKSIS